MSHSPAASDDWRALIDPQRLTAWMDTQGLEAGPIAQARLLTGGTQNLLLSFQRGAQRFVLRRPPAHPRQDGSETMRREARILAALGSTAVPHPRLIARCDDPAVLGAAFFLMAPIDGFTASGALPPAYAGQPVWQHQMGLAMVDALASLGQVDWQAVGLADLTRLDQYLARQPARWRATLDSYASYAGWPGPAGIRGLDEVQAWLETHRPAQFQPGIVHGDFHLGNLMFQHDAPQVAAIVDWELASIGEPLLDLGWLLATWPDAEGRSITDSLQVQPHAGLATEAALMARYAERSGRDLGDLRWWAVLACYKLGVLLEGTHARACAGKAPRDTGERLHAATQRLFDRARERIAQA